MNYYADLDISDDVIAAVDAGRKIEAIKILREETGLGLAEAKGVVDQLAREREGAAGAAHAPMQEVGGALVAFWSWGLMKTTGSVLLDRQAPDEVIQAFATIAAAN